MQLLVSPRDSKEAKEALAADIIDIKRPEEGSLGANFPWIIKEIKSFSPKPISVAIGDFPYLPGGASMTAYGAAAAGADYVKIGLMFNGKEKAREVVESVVTSVKTDFPRTKVVIAAYSDYARLNTISPYDISPIVADSGADIAMVDTGIKDGKSTFDFMDEKALQFFYNMNHDLGIMTALAGSIRFEDLTPLKRINPDIIGVRGMVCGGNRNSSIQRELVEKAMKMVR